MRSTSRNRDKSLIVISSPEKVRNEVEAIQRLFKLGLTKFHLRKPGWKYHEVKNLLQEIHQAYHPLIILHNHYELVKKYGLKGIHLTNHTKNSYAEEEFKDHHISISTHTLKEVQSLSSSYDYAFISPVFESISKKGYKPAVSVSKLSEQFEKRLLPTKLIALGGVKPDNLKQLQHTPFDGYAVLGYLWEDYKNDHDIQKIEHKFITLKSTIYEQYNKYPGVFL